MVGGDVVYITVYLTFGESRSSIDERKASGDVPVRGNR